MGADLSKPILMLQIGHDWFKLVRIGNLSEWIPNCPYISRLVQKGFIFSYGWLVQMRLYQISPNCSKWDIIGPNGSQLVPIGPNWSFIIFSAIIQCWPYPRTSNKFLKCIHYILVTMNGAHKLMEGFQKKSSKLSNFCG